MGVHRNKSRGGANMHEAQKNVCPLGAPRAGGAFGFLDTLKVHIQSN